MDILSNPDMFVPGLIFLFVISFVGTIPFPLPITITVVLLGQFGHPWWVVTVGTLGSVLGWAALEGVLRRWLESRPRLKNAIPAAYQRFFLKNTGFWLFVFNAIPFPFDPIRFLALLNGYPRSRFLLNMTASRTVRNTILVLIGMLLAPYKLLFWGALVLLMLLPLVIERLFFRRVFHEEVPVIPPELAESSR